ncbi:MAG: anti-sigma factor [Candidatus Zixiibacteriota bacterium]
MSFNLKNCLLLLAVCGIIVAAFGCGQKDDITKPKEFASLTLRPTYLPELDTLFIYELWAISDADGPGTSLGRFLWDNTLYRFRNIDGNAIDSVFELPGSFYDYDHLAISIENRDNNDSEPSGTFMLIDDVVDPVSRPIILKFPVSLFGAVGTYITATPTDDFLNFSNEDKGIWLCSRALTQRFNHDTLGVDNVTVVNVAPPVDSDTTALDTIGIVIPDTGWTIIDTTIIFGYDTIPHSRINFEYITEVRPDSNYLLFPIFDIDSVSPYRGLIQYYNYSTSLDELPDVSPYGWRYNAWVFHEYYPEAANLPEMVPFGYKLQHYYVGEPSWRVLALGPFLRPDSADLSNPYIDNREVPNFPGEDFILNLPPGYDAINFRYASDSDTTGGFAASIVVGVEPDPANLTIDETRNFPIFFLSKDIPYRFMATNNSLILHNYSQFLPVIEVNVKFHE